MAGLGQWGELLFLIKSSFGSFYPLYVASLGKLKGPGCPAPRGRPTIPPSRAAVFQTRGPCWPRELPRRDGGVLSPRVGCRSRWPCVASGHRNVAGVTEERNFVFLLNIFSV